MEELKTLEEWLNELPEPQRSQSLKRSYTKIRSVKYPSLLEALQDVFVWKDSLGNGWNDWEYWSNIANSGKEVTNEL